MTPSQPSLGFKPAFATRGTDSKLKAAAVLGGVGGALLFADLSLHILRPLDRSYYVVATVMALCMPATPLAFWLRGAVRKGWPAVVACCGASIVALGVAAWVAAFVLLFIDPAAAFTQHLTPGGSALMALGMIVFGAAVVASGRLSGPAAWAPLLVGLYFPLQLIAQLTFFLNGKDATPGPNGFILGAWGLVWAWACWSCVTARERSSA